jgi:hypothetical protein
MSFTTSAIRAPTAPLIAPSSPPIIAPVVAPNKACANLWVTESIGSSLLYAAPI